jgi:hypothetical protein
MTKDPRATLRAALATYIRSTYGIPIEQYRDAWANDGDTRYPFETLHVLDLYDSLAVE